MVDVVASPFLTGIHALKDFLLKLVNSVLLIAFLQQDKTGFSVSIISVFFVCQKITQWFWDCHKELRHFGNFRNLISEIVFVFCEFLMLADFFVLVAYS